MSKRLLTPIRHPANDRSIRWAKLVVLSALLGYVTYLAATAGDGIGGVEAVICLLVGAIVRL